jgi:demethylmacrocin O-methyltransferase
MDTLTELAIKYKADKWGKHNYTPYYYKMFQNKSKRRAVKKVVEIGSGEGASLFMWQDFFKNAMIYSPEIEDWRLFEKDRIKVIKCDQANQDDLYRVLKVTGTDIDLWVDDGSHKPEDQLYTFFQVFPILKPGATYVIEDIADESIFAKIPLSWKPELIVCGKRYDDKLIVCRK